MRILHLVDPGWPGGGGCTLRTVAETVARREGIEHEVLAFGSAAHADAARRCGLEPIGSAAIASRGRAVAAVIRAYERAHGPYDVIHSWSPRAGVIAVAAGPRRQRVVSVSRGPEPGRTAVVLKVSQSRVIVPAERVRRAWIEAGFAAGSIAAIAPAVNDARIDRAIRKDVRCRWGIAGKHDPFVVGALHEPAGELDAYVAMTIAARLALSGLDVRVLVHPDAHRRAEAELASHRLGFPEELLIVDDELAEPWRVASALDAAVRVGGRRAGRDFTPLLWAMAASVPVIAEDVDEASEVIEDEISGFLVPEGDINAVCARVARLHDDPEAARRLGESGAERVREGFGIEPFCERLRREYEWV